MKTCFLFSSLMMAWFDYKKHRVNWGSAKHSKIILIMSMTSRALIKFVCTRFVVDRGGNGQPHPGLVVKPLLQSGHAKWTLGLQAKILKLTLSRFLIWRFRSERSKYCSFRKKGGHLNFSAIRKSAIQSELWYTKARKCFGIFDSNHKNLKCLIKIYQNEDMMKNCPEKNEVDAFAVTSKSVEK